MNNMRYSWEVLCHLYTQSYKKCKLVPILTMNEGSRCC
jgi:hypothetical protein